MAHVRPWSRRRERLAGRERGLEPMNVTRTIVVMCLLLSGCGSCQRSEETPGSGAAPGAAAKPGAQAPIQAAGKIQVAPLQPTIANREGGAGHAPAEGNAPPGAGAPAGGGEAAAPAEGGEGDCIVVADADPDYGPPPLAVAFSAEAECSAGAPTYAWDFGDSSPPSTEANPSHTYSKPGDYTASVTVTGPNNVTASDEI